MLKHFCSVSTHIKAQVFYISLDISVLHMFPPMWWLTKTPPPSAPAPTPLPNCRTNCGPTGQRFARLCAILSAAIKTQRRVRCVELCQCLHVRNWFSERMRRHSFHGSQACVHGTLHFVHSQRRNTVFTLSIRVTPTVGCVVKFAFSRAIAAPHFTLAGGREPP